MLALAIAAAAPPAAAAPTRGFTIPPPTGLEAKLLKDAADGKLDQLSLLEASLIASGVADREVPSEVALASAILRPAVERARTQKSARARGATLLRALHDTVFRSYALTATEIDDVVATGEFNCLSSALLFVVAAEGLLDAPRAMVTRFHAYARVRVDGKTADVETTTPAGFDADRAALMTSEYVKQIAGPGTSAAELLADLQAPEELPVLSLVAAVYSNRAVGLVKRGDLPAAAVALDRAERLATGALKERLASWRGGVLNAGVVALVEEGRLHDARALLELALSGTQGKTRALLTANLQNVLLRLGDAALEQKDWSGALLHFDAAAKAGAPESAWGAPRARANAQLAALDGNSARCGVENVKPGSTAANSAAARNAAVCLTTMSRARRDQGDADGALQLSRRALALAPEDEDAQSAVFFALVEHIKRARERDQCERVEALMREARPYEAALRGQPWPHAEILGGCFAHAGEVAFKTREWKRAGALLQRAASHLPGDAAVRTNLARVDANQALEHAKAGACDAARPLAHRASQGDSTVRESMTRALEHCAHLAAEAAAARGDWATAAALARRGLVDAPDSANLKNNVGVYLHNQAVTLLKAKRCEEARALLPELRAAARDIASDVEKCRP